MPASYQPVYLVDRKDLRIEVIAHPVPHFLQAIVFGIFDGLEKVVVPGDAAAESPASLKSCTLAERTRSKEVTATGPSRRNPLME